MTTKEERQPCRECKNQYRHKRNCSLNRVPSRSLIKDSERGDEQPSDSPCWFCEYSSLANKRERAMLLMIVAAMPSDNSAKALCSPHREAWAQMGAKYRKATAP